MSVRLLNPSALVVLFFTNESIFVSEYVCLFCFTKNLVGTKLGEEAEEEGERKRDVMMSEMNSIRDAWPSIFAELRLSD